MDYRDTGARHFLVVVNDAVNGVAAWVVRTGYFEELFLQEDSADLERLSKEVAASPSLEV